MPTYTFTEVAQELGISLRRAHNLVRERNIPKAAEIRKGRGVTTIDQDALDSLRGRKAGRPWPAKDNAGAK